MKLKHVLIAAGAVAALALVLRETGAIGFELFQSRSQHRSNSNCESTSVPMLQVPQRQRETQAWKREPLPGFPGRELRYEETVEFPWSRWVPLLKTGTTTVARRFVVLANGGEVMSGSRTATIDLTVYGTMSAGGYGRHALEDERKSFVDWVVQQSRRGPANFPPAQSSPIVVRKDG